MRSQNEPAGVLFDVDGTLVDTTYLHTVIWWETLRQFDHDIPMARIHRSIGIGADKIIEHLLGDERDRSNDDKITEARGVLSARYWDRLRPLPGAVSLLRACAERGLRVVLATSASPSELAALRAALGADDLITAATCAADVSGADVSGTGPAPDVLPAALRLSGLDASRTVFVGDSVWDVVAAGRHHIPCIGLTCGGTGKSELAGAGAVAIYADPGALVTVLDESPVGALA